MKTARLALLPVLASLWGCATTSDRPPIPVPPPSSGELGYKEAVSLGTTFVAERGYGSATLNGVDQVSADVWRVRFGTGQDSALYLYYDGFKKTLVKAEDIQGITATSLPLSLVPGQKTDEKR